MILLNNLRWVTLTLESPRKYRETSTLKPNGRKPLAKTKQNNATNNNHKTPKLTKPQNQSCDLENKKTTLAVVKRVVTHTDKPTSNKPMKVERAFLIVKHKEHISKSKGHFIMFICIRQARYLTTLQLSHSK